MVTLPGFNFLYKSYRAVVWVEEFGRKEKRSCRRNGVVSVTW